MISESFKNICTPEIQSYRAYIVRTSLDITVDDVLSLLASRGLDIKSVSFLSRKHLKSPEYNGFVDCSTPESLAYLLTVRHIVYLF